MKELRSPAIFMASMDAWAKKSQYRELYKTMSKKTLGIAKAGFSEMTTVTPMSWPTWWATNHNRYIREGVTQRELLVLHECMHQFLTVYARGDLARDRKKETEKSGPEHDVHSL